MDWAEMTLFTLLSCIFVGGVLMVRAAARARKRAREGTPTYVEGIGFLAGQAVVFGGIAVAPFGNFAERASDGKLPANLWPSLLGGALGFLAFGITLGRLLMRRQMQRLLAERSAP
jgi:uncharacterized membrane protein YdcZ (DUF606 family)